MAFQDDMNAAWTAKEQQEELFKFRAKVQDIANNLKNGRNELDAIAAGAKFNTLSAAIKEEGAACLSVVRSADTALSETHAEFVNWEQPTE